MDSNDFNELFRIADKALYIAKQKGRNRFVIYDVQKHGKFHMTDESGDMTEIRDSFFSEKDLGQINKYLADMILDGRGCLPKLLEQVVHTVMADRIVIFWGRTGSLSASIRRILSGRAMNRMFLRTKIISACLRMT